MYSSFETGALPFITAGQMIPGYNIPGTLGGTFTAPAAAAEGTVAGVTGSNAAPGANSNSGAWNWWNPFNYNWNVIGGSIVPTPNVSGPNAANIPAVSPQIMALSQAAGGDASGLFPNAQNLVITGGVVLLAVVIIGFGLYASLKD